MTRPPARTQRNASDPASVADATGAQRRAEARDALDWREFAATEGGRRILAWLLEPLHALSYTQHANDTAHREGQRFIANEVRKKIKAHAPEALVLLAAAEAEALKRVQVVKDQPEQVEPE